MFVATAEMIETAKEIMLLGGLTRSHVNMLIRTKHACSEMVADDAIRAVRIAHRVTVR